MDNLFSNFYQHTSDLSKGVVEPTLRFNEISAKYRQQLLEQQWAAMESCVDIGVRQFRAVSEANDAKELAAVQTELAAEIGERFLSTAQNVFEIQVQTKEALGQLWTDGLQVAEVAPVVKPKAKPRAKVASPKKPAAKAASPKKPAAKAASRRTRKAA